jgi:hypothetical protein
MAIYIPIKLVEETDSNVVYHYECGEWTPDPDKPKRQRQIATKLGRLVLDKETGKIVRVTGEDWDAQDFYFSRVCQVLQRCWKKKEFPKETCYAA